MSPKMHMLIAIISLYIVAVIGQVNVTQPKPKPDGLPDIDWDILQMDPATRENLCQRQTAYCANNCGGPAEAPKNFCNVTSMAWNCGCSKKVPDFSPYLWPIVQAECSGRAQACQRQCNDQQQHQTGKPNCAVLCNDYYTCDSPNAPPSYLQTDTATETPSYNGPKKVVSTTPLANSTTNANQQQAHQGAGTAQAEIAWWLTIAMLIMVAF